MNSLLGKFGKNKKNGEINEDESIYEQIVERNYQVEQQHLSKLNSNQLADIVNKYDDFVNQYIAKQMQKTIMIEELEQKVEDLENQKNGIQMENEQYIIQVQEIQKHLNLEMTKAIEQQQEMSLIQNQNVLLKKKIQENQVGAGSPRYRGKGLNKSVNSSILNEDFEPRYKIEMDPDSQLLLFTDEKELQQLRTQFELIKTDLDALQQKLKDQGKENTEEYLKIKAEQGEQEEEEEEYTFEDLMMNAWDSYETFNENMENLKNNLSKVGQERDTIVQQNKEVNIKQEKQIRELQDEVQSQINKNKDSFNTIEQLQSDMQLINENFSNQKEQNIELQDKIRKLHQQITHKDQEIEQQKQDVSVMIEEKNSLKEEIMKLSGMFTNEEQNYKDQIESILKKQDEDNKQKENEYNKDMENWTKDMDDLETDYDKVCEELKKSENNLKEMETKLRQEQLKVKQTEKELTKLDEKFKKTKMDLEEMIVQNDQNREKIVKLEEKRMQDKKKMKEQKQKISELQESESTFSLAQVQEQERRDEQLLELQAKVMEYEKKTNLKEEVKKMTLDKDMKINNLDLLLDQAKTELNDLKEKHKKVQNENQRLDVSFRQQETKIKQMQEKREMALGEIKRLTVQIEMMKNVQNPQQMQKMKQIEDLIQKADRLNNSFSSEQNYNMGGGVHVDSSPSLPEKPTNNQFFSKQNSVHNSNNNILAGLDLSRKNSGSSNNNMNSSQQSNQNTNTSLKELKCLQMIMGDLQKLYKEYIMVAFSIKDNKELLKFEKKFNDMIKKAQDLMDTLEDSLD